MNGNDESRLYNAINRALADMEFPDGACVTAGCAAIDAIKSVEQAYKDGSEDNA